MKKNINFIFLTSLLIFLSTVGCKEYSELTAVSNTKLKASKLASSGLYASDLTQLIADSSGKVSVVYADVFTPIAQGVDETEINFKNTSGDTIRAFITRVDLNTSGLSLRTATPYDRQPSLNTGTGKNYVQTIPVMGEHIQYGNEKILAGINGDFYNVTTNVAKGPLHRKGTVWKSSFDGGSTQQGITFVGVKANGSMYIADKSEYSAQQSNLMEVTGAGVMLVQNGQVVNNSALPQSADDPRTAIGYTANNIVYMLVVDGRAPGYSRGAKYDLLSGIMKALKVETAVNLDGGGSSTKVIRNPVSDALQVINRPSDATGARSVANGWVVVSNYQVSTIAGSTSYGFVDGMGTAARFRNPDGVVLDQQGNIVITDRTNHSIRKMTTAAAVSTIAGTGVAGFADGSPGQFKYPWQSTVDASGNILVVDKEGARIRKIASNGNVSTLAGNGVIGFADGTPGNFNNPLDVVVDSYGNIFVADRDNKRIRKITTSGIVSTFVGDGTTNILKNPIALAIDPQNNLYLSDGNTIKKITPAKVITTIVGDGVKGFSDGVRGQPLTAQIGDVYGLCFDTRGRLYLADATNHRIRRVTPTSAGNWSNAIIATVAGTGVSGKVDGLANSARFNLPYDMVVDALGNIYVADNANHCIRKISY